MYARVRYQNIYPGIDLTYYGNRQQLEYDLLLRPGAAVKAITLSFEGADGLDLDAQGSLAWRRAGVEMRQHKPVVYQEIDGRRREIQGAFVLKENNRVGFQVASYDSSKPLIIDPALATRPTWGAAPAAISA